MLLADEINRTPPRTQAALLEAMQERQVTVEGKAHKLPDPFLVIATQNPYEHRDVFELPESQLDRFLFKLVLDYADAQSEYEMLDLPHPVAPDMLGEVRPLLGVVGLDQARDQGHRAGHARRGAAAARRRRARQARDELDATDFPRRSAATWSRSRGRAATSRASSSA